MSNRCYLFYSQQSQLCNINQLMYSPTQKSKGKYRIRTNSISAWDTDVTCQIPSPLLKLKNFTVKPAINNSNQYSFGVKEPCSTALNRTSVFDVNKYGRRTKTSAIDTFESYKPKSVHVLRPLILHDMKESYYIWQKEDPVFCDAFKGMFNDVTRRRQLSQAKNQILVQRRKKGTSITHQRRYSKTPIINIRGPTENDEEKTIYKKKTLAVKKKDKSVEKLNETLSSINAFEKERKYIKRSWKRRFDLTPSRMDY